MVFPDPALDSAVPAAPEQAYGLEELLAAAEEAEIATVDLHAIDL